MTKLGVADLVNSIAQLGVGKTYLYYSGNTYIRITEIRKPEGPIKFERWGKQKTQTNATAGTISTNQFATAAAAFSGKPDYPIHFDRLFSGGGNSRSALETLLAYTPHFFICHLQRAEPYTGVVKDKLKHIMWRPNEDHPLGVIGVTDCDQMISEVEIGISFGEINVTPGMLGDEFDTIEAKKAHTQMQVALVEIGNALNFRTWIARNDRSIQVGGTELGKLNGVIQSLEDVPIFYTAQIRQAAALIDCIWFSKDFQYIPAIIEVEHSTGVTSGLTRMLKFVNTIPSIATKFTIVAPNELRNKVVSEVNNAAFRTLRARYMPYSTVRELYGLIKRYSLSDVVERNFIEPFMENVVEGQI